MSAKQHQITSFFQNKKQKINDNVDKSSASSDVTSNSLNESQDSLTNLNEFQNSSNNLNESQDEPESFVEISSLEPTKALTSANSKITCELICCKSDHP